MTEPVDKVLLSDPAYWHELYESAEDGWDQGRAAPPLERWFAQHPPGNGRETLVVGCGRGHEARLLARHGARVVGVDFAARAIAEARALTPPGDIAFVEGDLFALAEDPRRYDLVVEHCTFCAIDPSRRSEYVRVIREVLRPGGQLVGLFYTHARPGGPPFTTSKEELHMLFEPAFRFVHEEVPDDSVSRRQGLELLVSMERSSL